MEISMLNFAMQGICMLYYLMKRVLLIQIIHLMHSFRDIYAIILYFILFQRKIYVLHKHYGIFKNKFAYQTQKLLALKVCKTAQNNTFFVY